MKVGETFQGLPKRAQGIIAVVALLIIVFLIYEIYKAIKSAGQLAGAKDELNQNRTEIQKLQALGMKQSYPDSQYLTWSNDLQEGLNGCLFYPSTVEKVFGSLKNDIDFLKLKEAFGVREIKGCMFASNQNKDLSGAYEWKVWGSTDANAMMKKAGIKYQV